MFVPDVVSFDHVNNLFADVDRLISDPFEVTRQEDLSERVGDVFGAVEHIAEDAVAEQFLDGSCKEGRIAASLDLQTHAPGAA